MLNVDKKAICDKYGSIKVFCEDENVKVSTFYKLCRKKGFHFQKGSRSFKIYHKLKDQGFILDEANAKDIK